MVDGRRELGDGQENVTAPSAPPCLDAGQPTSTGHFYDFSQFWDRIVSQNRP
jgi:hypothetical protein